MIQRNDPCWCGSQKKWKKCHYPTEPTSFQSLADAYLKNYQIILKKPEQIEGIRRASQLAASILKKTCAMAKEGVTTNELNAFAAQLHKEAGALPAPLGYGMPPFPKEICTSLNDVICHGIPDDTPLKQGDFLNIDITSILNGYYGDCSAMVAIGKIDEDKKLLMDTCKRCLDESIAILKPGVLLHEIGGVIEGIAASKGFSVVDEFIGHGIGISFHEPPQILHYRNQSMIPLVAGMTFTVEPMINAGVKKAVMDANQWTARTADHKMSAQWEHTVLITPTGHEILTVPHAR